MKRISVILPVYNVSSVLKRSLDSVCGQTYENLEIVLVDDGSTDESGAICDQYAAADPRIRVLHQQNQGLGCARNAGLELATGEYVSFVDSDDYLALTTYEQLLREPMDWDICFFGHCRVLDETVTPYDVPPEKTYYAGAAEIVGDLFSGCLLGKPGGGRCFTGISACSALYRRSLIEKTGLRFRSEREVLSEDILFNLEICAVASAVRICPQYFYYYVQRAQSLTERYLESRFRDALRMDVLLKQLAADHSVTAFLQEGIDRCFCMNLIVCMKQEVRFEGQNGRASVFSRLREMGSCERTRQCLSSGAFQAGFGRKMLRWGLHGRHFLWIYGILKAQLLLERFGRAA